MSPNEANTPNTPDPDLTLEQRIQKIAEIIFGADRDYFTSTTFSQNEGKWHCYLMAAYGRCGRSVRGIWVAAETEAGSEEKLAERLERKAARILEGIEKTESELEAGDMREWYEDFRDGD